VGELCERLHFGLLRHYCSRLDVLHHRLQASVMAWTRATLAETAAHASTAMFWVGLAEFVNKKNELRKKKRSKVS